MSIYLKEFGKVQRFFERELLLTKICILIKFLVLIYACLNVKHVLKVYIKFVIKYLTQLIITPTMEEIIYTRSLYIVIQKKHSDTCALPTVEIIYIVKNRTL